jgi:uncharacterized LabA/DUF88 family protein
VCVKKPPEKVALFVDVLHCHYATQQQYQRALDYQAFWASATKNREVVIAIAYDFDCYDNFDGDTQRLLLSELGFNVKVKSCEQHRPYHQNDWSVGITLDIIEQAARADVIVLLTGNDNFDVLLDKIRLTYGMIMTIEVYAVATTTTAFKHSAHHFISIDETLLL